MNHALVFDSGVGGLSVVREMRSLMPNLRISYVADDEFRPYGDKSEKALRRRLPGLLASLEIMLEPDIIVLACNTASTTALHVVRAATTAPVIGVVPAVKPAAVISKTGIIGVLGTPGTVRRRYVDDLIDRFAQDTEVLLHGSTALVDLAERKLSGETIDLDNIKQELIPLFAKPGIDCVVLACTHFPLLKPELEAAAPTPVTWVDSGEAIARRVQSILTKKSGAYEAAVPQVSFLVGGEREKLERAIFSRFGFTDCIRLSSYQPPDEIGRQN